MAGIMANSVSQAMGSGDTAADKSFGTYLLTEQITLSTTPTGSTYSWGMATPSGSTVRSALSDVTAAAPTFTPDVAGYYVITCTVDSTTVYVLRISVVAVALTSAHEAWRMQPLAASQVPSPPLGESLFLDSSVLRLRRKNSSGTVRDVDPGARTGTVTLVAGAGTITDTSVTASTVVVWHATALVNQGAITTTVTPGVGVTLASTSGTDGSTFRYSLIG